MTRVIVVCTVLLAILVTACGGSNKVGSDPLLNFEDEAASRLGEATPTPTPDADPTQAPEQASMPALTEAPQQERTEQIAIDISIRGDNVSGSQFDPPVIRVFVGSLVRWTNADTQPRSVVSDQGAFGSDTLAPGESWVWEAAEEGVFNYHDGTRPYAVGRLEVVAE